MRGRGAGAAGLSGGGGRGLDSGLAQTEPWTQPSCHSGLSARVPAPSSQASGNPIPWNKSTLVSSYNSPPAKPCRRKEVLAGLAPGSNQERFHRPGDLGDPSPVLTVLLTSG